MSTPLQDLHRHLCTIRPKNGDTRLLLAGIKGTVADLIEEERLINCLSYALRFWEENPKYKIYYNSDHVINLREQDDIDQKAEALGLLAIEEFGYDYFNKWHNEG